MLASGRFNTPGLAAREAEEVKFKNDRESSLPTSLGPHRLVPFAIEEFGRFGRRAMALLRELASRGVTDGFLKPPSSWLSAKRPQILSYYWVDHWLQDISATLALHLASIVVNHVGA